MEKSGRNYLQCTQCGQIIQVNEEVSYKKIYVYSYCNCCEHTEKMLNLGENELDKYKYYDVALDERYFTY